MCKIRNDVMVEHFKGHLCSRPSVVNDVAKIYKMLAQPFEDALFHFIRSALGLGAVGMG